MRLHAHMHLVIRFGFAASIWLASDARAGGNDSGSVGAVVIFDNIAGGGGFNADGASPASQLDAAFPFDAGAADDFVLPESTKCLWSVTGVQWTGVYWNGTAPGGITGVRVIVWPDTPDGPDGRGGLVPNIA